MSEEGLQFMPKYRYITMITETHAQATNDGACEIIWLHIADIISKTKTNKFVLYYYSPRRRYTCTVKHYCLRSGLFTAGGK